MMSIPKLGMFILLILLSTGVFADDKEAITQVVRHYNLAIIAAGKTGDTEVVKPFVSEKIAMKTHAWIMAWQDDKLKMVAKLLKLRFDKVDVKGSASQVTTYEEWIYHYDHPTKKDFYPEQKIFYTIKYTLHRVKDHWLIDDIHVLNEKQIPLEKLKK
jgi:hypothetical protein